MLRRLKTTFGVKYCHDFPEIPFVLVLVKSKTINAVYQHSPFQTCIFLLTLHIKHPGPYTRTKRVLA